MSEHGDEDVERSSIVESKGARSRADCVVERRPRGQYLPLNSKRLTAAHLRRIAATLELPTTGATKQLRQVIKGKLETEGYEALNVQVLLETKNLSVVGGTSHCRAGTSAARDGRLGEGDGGH